MLSAGLVAVSTMAFGFMAESGLTGTDKDQPCQVAEAEEEPIEVKAPNFFYDLGTRFQPVRKSVLEKARSINDFVSAREMKDVFSYQSVRVVIVENDIQTDVQEAGTTAELTKAQRQLLQTAAYSTNFVVWADYQMKNEAGALEDNYFSPYMTVVPEEQARYSRGEEAFLEYLQANNEMYTMGVDRDSLRAAKLYFTVSSTGNITDVHLDRTSGYEAIDEQMIKLLSSTPGNWVPAQNKQGENVDQELVVSFGLAGC